MCEKFGALEDQKKKKSMLALWCVEADTLAHCQGTRKEEDCGEQRKLKWNWFLSSDQLLESWNADAMMSKPPV